MVLAYGFWNTIGKFFAPLVLTLVQATNDLNYKVPILTQWGFLGIMLPIFIWLPETPGERVTLSLLPCRSLIAIL